MKLRYYLHSRSFVLHAERAICYRSSVCLSVCLSHGWIVKTVEVRIMQFSPYSSQFLYVVQDKFHPEILPGSSRADASNKSGVGKTTYFVAICVSISKTARDTSKDILLMITRKLHMLFPLAPRSKFEFSRNFAWLRRFERQQRLNEWR